MEYLINLWTIDIDIRPIENRLKVHLNSVPFAKVASIVFQQAFHTSIVFDLIIYDFENVNINRAKFFSILLYAFTVEIPKHLFAGGLSTCCFFCFQSAFALFASAGLPFSSS